MSQEEILKKYRRYLVANDKSEISINNYMIAVRQALEIKKKAPETWTLDDLYDIKAFFKEKHKEQNSLISKTSAINNLMKCYHGNKTELKLSIPRSISKNKDYVKEEEITRMLQANKRNLRTRAMILTLTHSGARARELCNLNIEDILWDTQKIKINDGKGNTYEIVNIKSEALQAIKEYLGEERNNITAKNGHEKALFLSDQRRRMSYSSIYRIIKNAGIKAGIKRRIHPHLFRASMITFMDKSGASIFEIQKQSRHKEVKTLEKYVRHTDEHIKEVYEKTMPEFTTEKNRQSDSEQPQQEKESPKIQELLERIKQLEQQVKQNNNKTDYIQ